MTPEQWAAMALEVINWIVGAVGKERLQDALTDDAIKRANLEADIAEAVKLATKG